MFNLKMQDKGRGSISVFLCKLHIFVPVAPYYFHSLVELSLR